MAETEITLSWKSPERHAFAHAWFPVFNTVKTPSLSPPASPGAYVFECWEDDVWAATEAYEDQRDEFGEMPVAPDPVNAFLGEQNREERSNWGRLIQRYVGETNDLARRLGEYWSYFHRVATWRVPKAQAAAMLGISTYKLQRLIDSGVIKTNRGAGKLEAVSIRSVRLLQLKDRRWLPVDLGSERPATEVDQSEKDQTRRVAHELAAFLGKRGELTEGREGAKTITYSFVNEVKMTSTSPLGSTSLRSLDTRLLLENALLVTRPQSGRGVTHLTLNRGIDVEPERASENEPEHPFDRMAPGGRGRRDPGLAAAPPRLMRLKEPALRFGRASAPAARRRRRRSPEVDLRLGRAFRRCSAVVRLRCRPLGHRPPDARGSGSERASSQTSF